MIKKLRLRFICVNMTILTCVMLSVLTAVFVLMYRSEVKVSEEIMDSIIASNTPSASEGQTPPPPPPDEGYGTEPMAGSAADGTLVPLGHRDEEMNTTTVAVTTTTVYGEAPPPYDEDQYYLDDRYFDWFEEVAPQPQWGNRPDDDEMRPPPRPQETTVDSGTSGTRPPQPPMSDDGKFTTTSPVVTGTPPTQSATTTTTTRSTATESTSRTATATTTASVALTTEVSTTKDTGYLRGSIYLKVDENRQIEDMSTHNSVQNTLGDMTNAIQQVFDSGDSEGKIRLDNIEYRYRLVPNDNAQEYNLVLLDRSIELSTLSRLLIIFLIIAMVGLVVLFGISVALANWAIKPVELAWEKQKQFVADASHELKTPLAVISTNTDVILSNPDGTVREQAKWLQYIKDETVRMSKLVSNLLFIAKSDAKQVGTTMQAIDLSELVSSVCLVFESVVYENGKKLEQRIQSDIQYVCDEDKMKQLLTILLDNAVLHSVDNAEIAVSLSQDAQDKIRIVVSNTANDIPKEALERLFDRFYRLDTSRAKRTGGSGLGLNIAQTIVQFHGGTIVASSENGTVSFIITL